jgi:hypothetical protein
LFEGRDTGRKDGKTIIKKETPKKKKRKGVRENMVVLDPKLEVGDG